MTDAHPPTTLEALREALPDAAKDLRLNLQSVLRSELLTPDQTWGIALTSAYFLKDDTLRAAILHEVQQAGVSEAVVDDAKAAAALMGMNTIYYRFRHMVGKEPYAQLPARLRMQRMATPASDKATFELFSMACAVLAGCELCVRSHEASILKHGLTPEHVHESVRIAAVLAGVAIARTL